MEDNTLLDVYLDELKDIWSANEQMFEVVSEMVDAAGNRRLGELLKRITMRLEARNRTIRDLLTRHGVEEGPIDQSRAMVGLAEQAREETLEKPLTDAARDVVIIAQVQRMAHYCIAGYGTARALAEALALPADAQTLSTDLDTVYASDELLTHLAETVINPSSADEDEDTEDEDEEEDAVGILDESDEEKNGYDDGDLDDEDDEEEDEDEGRMK